MITNKIGGMVLKTEAEEKMAKLEEEHEEEIARLEK